MRMMWLVLVGALGCAVPSKYSRPSARPDIEPEDDEAVIVFLRPSKLGDGMEAFVFECWDGEPSQLVGFVGAHEKVVYRTTPGEHLFMVVGEAADFMHAHLEAGKVYYVLATIRMGAARARFSLHPVHAGERHRLGGWLRETSWAENTPAAGQWAEQNADDIEEKRSRYYAAWWRKQPHERPVLTAADGR
jgi:hypothetical protein